MSKFYKYLFLCLFMIFVPISFIACGGDPTPTPSFIFSFSSENVAYGSVSCSSGGSPILSGTSVERDTTLILVATENEGYTFDGWYEGSDRVSSDKTYTFTMPSRALTLVAKYNTNTYLLTYFTESETKGTVSSETASGSNVSYNTSVTLIATENEGYTFDGWYEGSEKVSSDKTYTFTMPSRALTLVAKYNTNTYLLTYSTESETKGTVSSEIASGSNVSYNTSVTLIATENEGYTFDGWYEESEKVSSDKTYTFTMPSRALTLVAKYNTNTYLLTYSTESETKGSVNSETASGSNVSYNASVTLIATENEGYTFDGWYEGSEKVSSDKTYNFTMPSRALTLVAKYNTNTYLLTYSTESEIKGTVSSETASGSNVSYNTSVTLIATENEGYTFDGWYKGSDRVSSDKTYNFTMPSRALTLVAKYNTNTYLLTYSTESETKGSVSSETASGSNVSYNTSVTLIATENEGYTFDGWYEGSEKVSSDKTYTFTMPSRALTLVAKYNTNTYLLTYSTESETKGSVNSETASGSNVAYSASVTLIATENEGYTFDGWYEGSDRVSSDKTYNFTMPSRALTLVAKYNTNTYLLTYSTESETKGSVSSETASGSNVSYNTSVTLIATENEGYTFDGWYEGSDRVSSDKTYTFSMPSRALTLVARFNIQSRTVYFYDGTTLIDTKEVDYNSPAPVESVNLQKEGYDFIGWFTSSNHAYNGEGVTSDLDLYAQFERAVVLYTVRFFDFDGVKLAGDQRVEQGSSAMLPADPSRTGYNFVGWESGGDILPSAFVVESDMNIFASYTQKEYLVKFYDEEGGSLINSQSVKHDETASRPQTPEKTGYIFLKWLLNGYEYDFDTKVTDALDIYGEWKEVEKTTFTFTVTFLDDDGENVIDAQIVEEGEDATAPQQPSKIGKVFKQWSGDFSSISENKKIYAIYDVATFEVTFAYYSETEEKDVEHVVVVEYGSSATAPSDYNKEGYTFSGWDKAIDNITSDMKVTAIYIVKTFTATFMLGVDEYTTESAQFGETFHIPSTPQVAGYSFMGWFADDELDVSFDFTSLATEDVTVYGKLELIVIATYTVRFEDYNKELISEQTIVDGKSAIAPGRPTREGYTFTSWDKAFDNVTSNMTITAQYRINRYTIAYLENDRETTIDSVECNYGSDATSLVTAPDIVGKSFLRWSKDLSFVSKDETVYAIYASNIVKVHFLDENDNELFLQNVEYGSHASVPSTPTKAGCIFKTWVTEKGGSTSFDFNTVITEEISVYAQWENVSGIYSVYFKDYDGHSYGNTQRILAGYFAEEPVAPVKAGTEFDGWYIEGSDEKFDFETPISRTITLIARAKVAE